MRLSFDAARIAASLTEREPAFRAAMIATLIIAPLLMLLTGLQLSRELDRGRELRTTLDQSYERRSELQQVFSLVQDAELGQRGYLLTRNPADLRPYLAARPKILARTRSVADRLTGSANQRARAERLVTLVEARLALIDAALASADLRGVGETAPPDIEAGRRSLDAIRTTIADLAAAEAVDLSAYTAEQQNRARNARRGILALFLLLGAVVAGSGLLFMRHVNGRRALQTHLQEVAARQQAVLDGVSDAIVTLNPSGSIETVNAAGLRMFGRGEAELLRRDASAILVFEDQASGGFRDRLLGPGANLSGGLVREMLGRRGDGTTFPVETALGEIALADGPRTVAIVRDISERRRMSQMKDEFVSTVSHELRTPLTSIAGSLGLVAGGAAGPLPEKAMRLIGIAQSNCRRLVRLINDILDIEKMESGKTRFDMKPAPLGEIAARSIESVRGFADESEVKLRLAMDGAAPMIRGDADRLVQVTVNLLSNAIKFTPPGREVVLTVASIGETARLSVSDSGPGVPADFQESIFQKFAQADGSDTRQKGGTGLGLAIAREIVERHGGRLWFENDPAGGAVFHADLAKVGEHAAVSEPGVRLLVCEDEVVTAAALREVLEDEGFVVDVAETIADAEQALRRTHYACLVTDLRLPDGDGLAMIRRIRDSAENARMPVIIVSGDAARRREQARSLALDVTAWMAKPVDPVRLKDTILAAVSDDRKPLILHVDDDRDMLQLTAAALSGVGEVVSVAGLAEARALLKQRRPDAVVLDLGLEDGSGLDLLQELKTAVGGPVPVVIFSAQLGDADLAARVDAVMTKSRTSLTSLTRTVRGLVSAPAERREPA